MPTPAHGDSSTRTLTSKVPEITLWFWVIKVCCTTVGETAADFLDVNLNFGLAATSGLTGVLLAVVLWARLRAPRYIPTRYWTTVALISVFGTLVTDNLTDNVAFPLEASTVVFAVLLAVVLLTWYRSEGTLRSTRSSPDDASFYWTPIFVTFALGTATGDLMAEGLGLGYTTTGRIVTGLIAVAVVGRRRGLHSVLSFWMIYILTRPLGASIGDYLSQPLSHGGPGLGATLTSVLFLGIIIGIVVLLTATEVDTIPPTAAARDAEARERGGRGQTVVVVCVLLLASGTGHAVKRVDLSDRATAAGGDHAVGSAGAASPLGDLSTFRTIARDIMGKVAGGDRTGATARVDDLEFEMGQRSVDTPTARPGSLDRRRRQERKSAPRAPCHEPPSGDREPSVAGISRRPLRACAVDRSQARAPRPARVRAPRNHGGAASAGQVRSQDRPPNDSWSSLRAPDQFSFPDSVPFRVHNQGTSVVKPGRYGVVIAEKMVAAGVQRHRC